MKQASAVRVEIFGDSRYPVDRELVREAVTALLDRYGMSDKRVLVEVSIVGNRKIHALNRKYRNIDRPTDVLSFPLEEDQPGPDGYFRLGDVVVSYPEARRTAILMNRMIDVVVADLVEHGIKHLLGEHHE